VPRIFLLLTLITLMLTAACNTKHEIQVAPVEVKPIHITIDVNIKVDRALDDFFGDLDNPAKANNGVKPTPDSTTK